MESLFFARVRNTVRGRGLLLLLGLAGALALSSQAFAADSPLTLAEAQRRALERSRQLAAQDFAVDASRQMAVAAGQLPDPVLKFGVNNLPVEGGNRFSVGAEAMTMRSVGIAQTLTGADKRALRTQRYQYAAEKSLAEKDVNIAAIERDTALAWLERHYAEAMAAVVAEQRQQAQLEIEAADAQYRGGRGSQADIFAARSMLADIDDQASQMQRRILNAKTMLARWVGNHADAALAAKPATDSVRLDPATLERDLAHHPELNVLRSEQDIASTEANLAAANRRADWSVELAFQQRGPAYANMVSVGLSIPLQWNQKQRQQRELSSRLALAEQVQAVREETLRMHVAEVRVMLNEWRSNRERLARYQREQIPLAQERSRAALAAYQGGKSSLTEALATRRNIIDVRLQALQLEAATSRLWAQINYLFPQNAVSAYAQTPMHQESK